MAIGDVLEVPTDRPLRTGQPDLAATTTFVLPTQLADRLAALADRHSTGPASVAFAGFLALLHRYTDADELVLAGWTGGPDCAVNVGDDPSFAGLLGRVRSQVSGAVRGIALTVRPHAGQIQCRLDYDANLYDLETIDRLRGQLLTLLDGAVGDPATSLSALPLLTALDRGALAEFNATAVHYPTDRTVPELISAQAASTPDAIALVFEGATLTYGELEQRTNQLAHHLRSLGVTPGSTVAVSLDRSFELVIALVGVLKAGAAYVPLEPSYPAARLAFMLADSAAPVLLSHKDLAERLPASADGRSASSRAGEGAAQARVLRLDADWAEVAAQPVDPLPASAAGTDVAYIIYTSGSTGRPKGVPNTHAGLLNRLQWMQEAYELTDADAVLQKTPCGFDVSVWEFFWPLMTGARLVVARPGGHRDPHYLAELIRTEGVTFLHFVPSMLQVFLDVLGAVELAGCSSLRQVVCSGEALAPALVDQFFQARLKAGLDNLYGPTEAAIDVTRWTCRPGETKVPIGHPIANTTTYVVDRYGNQVPVGIPGELCLGGVQVALGYLNRPDLTQAAFVPDPFADPPGETGARMYRTGDLARWRTDGALEYLGRRDHQVKLRGLRIELGEIESALRAHSGITDAAVLLRNDTVGEPILVAYLVCRRQVSIADLRHRLGIGLPDYMVPEAYLVIDEMPLSPNGKLDRAALLALPLPGAVDRPDYVPPRTTVEGRLAEIWGQVLGVAKVGIHDDFFALGGHSLRAVKVLAQINEEFGVTVPLASIFRARTLDRFAAQEVEPRLAGLADLPEEPVLRPRHAEVAPLSSPQRRLWFLHQMYPDMYAYHLPIAYDLRGALDVAALEQALTELLRRHEVLRSRLISGADGEPVQVVGPPTRVELPILRVPAVTDDMLRERVQVPFDLGHDRPLRAELFELAPDHHVLLLTVQHLVADAWSMGVIAEELSAHYTAAVRGLGATLPELPLQFADYVLWQNEALRPETLDQQLAYWTTRLAGLAPLELVTDRPRTPTRSFAGRRCSGFVEPELLDRLRNAGRSLGVSDFMLLATGLQAILQRYTNQDDIAIGFVSADRHRPGLGQLAGFLVNTLVLRTDLGGEVSFVEAARRVRDAVLEAHENQDVPFDRVVNALDPIRDLSRSPLFGVALSYLHTPELALSLPGVEADERVFDPGIVRFDLDVFMSDRDGGVVVDMDYRTDLFDDATVRRLIDDYLRLLTAAAAAPDLALRRLDIVDEQQRRELAALGQRRVDYPRSPLVPELVALRANQDPDAVALRDAERSLTYAELESMADGLARQLRAAGAGRDVLVGVLAERSVEYVAGLYAVLKAGSAYVPMDPSFPDNRLVEILDDSRAPIVLTTKALAPRIAQLTVQVVWLDDELAAAASVVEPAVAAIDPIQPSDVAYVIYTSGSTGRPKGCLVEHRGLLNMCHWNNRAYEVDSDDRGSMVAAQGFDASVWELWPYLIAGASVSICDETTRTDPDQLAQWLIDEDVDVTFLATPLAEAMLDTELVDRLPVRVILTGGDKLRQRPRPGLPFALVNHYGPTECTVISTAGVVYDSDVEQGAISIGEPTDNADLYLLDEFLNPVPRGVGGELYIGGIQVARGYLDRPELTLQRFVPNPYGVPGDRLYRTGDLARWRNDGQLEFLGRADRQIKIRGFRIEPGEIETRLRAHPGVVETFVTADGDAAFSRRLVAYLVPTQGEAPDPAELKAWLREQLPEYMVPTQYVPVPEFPMTSNGKVDRLRLPEPPHEVEAPREYVAPRDDVELAIADLFAQILERDRVGIHDNFFELGGHSLRAAKLAAWLRRDFNVDLPMQAVFAGPTVAELAVALLETALADADPSAANAPVSPAPASPASVPAKG
jgi:amino acid adenylation domain-containing protein